MTLCAPLAVARLGHNAVWLLAFALALAFIHLLGFMPAIPAGQLVTAVYVWVPSLNLGFPGSSMACR